MASNDPPELATSYVDFAIGEINGKIKSAESSIKFHENYKPGPTASRPSNVEPGSMDANDWDVAEMDAEQSENEREERIESYRRDLEELQSKFSDLDDDKDDIKEGDAGLIEKYSALERERREKLEKLQKARSKKV